MVPASRSATLTERWTFAEEYCPSLQLCRHQNSFTTSMEPSGRAEEASFTKRVRRHSLTVSASSSEKPVFSASWTLMEPLISYRPKRTKCFMPMVSEARFSPFSFFSPFTLLVIWRDSISTGDRLDA